MCRIEALSDGRTIWKVSARIFSRSEAVEAPLTKNLMLSTFNKRHTFEIQPRSQLL